MRALGDRLTDSIALYAGDHDLTDPYLSPIFGDVTGFPPTFVQAGTRDLFLANPGALSPQAARRRSRRRALLGNHAGVDETPASAYEGDAQPIRDRVELLESGGDDERNGRSAAVEVAAGDSVAEEHDREFAACEALRSAPGVPDESVEGTAVRRTVFVCVLGPSDGFRIRVGVAFDQCCPLQSEGHECVVIETAKAKVAA